jgi:hypothetical protein
MNDWTEFTEAVPWFLNDDAVVKVGKRRAPRAFSPAAAKLFPRLAELLAMGSVMDVSVDGIAYELVAWTSSDGDRFGWLCLPPSAAVPQNLHADHRDLLASFGGIVERFNEPEDTWLLNLEDALTERETARDVTFIQEYDWAFEDAGLTLPIEPSDYYSIACEANGNVTLCHRENGHVLMFAPDHNFEHLTELEGCPEYTLYRIGGAANLREWVDAVAVQWLDYVGRSQG